MLQNHILYNKGPNAQEICKNIAIPFIKIWFKFNLCDWDRLSEYVIDEELVMNFENTPLFISWRCLKLVSLTHKIALKFLPVCPSTYFLRLIFFVMMLLTKIMRVG